MLRADRDGVARDRVGGRGDEGSVGGVQIFDPPPAAVGGELGLPAAEDQRLERLGSADDRARVAFS